MQQRLYGSVHDAVLLPIDLDAPADEFVAVVVLVRREGSLCIALWSLHVFALLSDGNVISRRVAAASRLSEASSGIDSDLA